MMCYPIPGEQFLHVPHGLFKIDRSAHLLALLLSNHRHLSINLEGESSTLLFPCIQMSLRGLWLPVAACDAGPGGGGGSCERRL